MANIGKSKFSKILSAGTFPLPSPVIMAGGNDNVTSVIATQINWGEGTEILGYTLEHGYTSEFFDAIEKGVNTQIAQGALDEEAVNTVIGQYIKDNGVVPSVSVTNGSAQSGKYISGISATGHKLTVTFDTLPTHPTAAQLWGEYAG